MIVRTRRTAAPSPSRADKLDLLNGANAPAAVCEWLEPRRLLSTSGYGTDPYFGTNGFANVQFTVGVDAATTVLAALPDGRIYLCANGALARLTIDGQLDPTFGSGGKVLGNNSMGGTSMAIQPDGKILVGGPSDSQRFSLTRYNPDGSVDTTFGTGGTVIAGSSRNGDTLNKVFLQPNGNIVAAGYGYNGNHYIAEVMRFHPNGSPDIGFGTNGVTLSDLGPLVGDGPVASSVFNSGMTLPDGRILLTGAVGDQAMLAMYQPSGALDATYADRGVAHPAKVNGSDPTEQSSSIVNAPGGGYYVMIGSYTSGLYVSKWTAAGQIDTSWGVNGVQGLAGGAAVGELAVQPDQSLVATGGGLAVTVIDPTGKNVLFSAQQANAPATGGASLALEPDGRAIVGGGGSGGTPQNTPPYLRGSLVFRYRTMASPPEGVRLEGSVLTVLGEGASNNVRLSSDGTNDSVTLNGSLQTFPASAVSLIDVRLLGGANHVTSGPGVPLDVVDMSNGDNNTAEIDGRSLYLIDPGTGYDSVLLPPPADAGATQAPSNVLGAASDTLVLSGTGGDDAFSVSQSAVASPGRALTYSGIGHVYLSTGAGNDAVTINAAPTTNVRVQAGDGNDVFTVTGGGKAAAPDVISAGAGNNRLVATTAASTTLQYLADPAGATAVQVLAGNAGGQQFTLADAAVQTSDGYALTLAAAGAPPGPPPDVRSLEVDGSPGNDTFTLARTVVGTPTTIEAGAGIDTYTASNLALPLSSNVVFQAGGQAGDAATLNEPAVPADPMHRYSIVGGMINRDGVAGFQYTGLAQLSLRTGSGGSYVSLADLTGLSQLSLTTGGGRNTVQASPANPGPAGLGMAANARITIIAPQGGPDTFRVTPDPNAAYSITGSPNLQDQLQVAFPTGATGAAGTGTALTVTGKQSGKYTFASAQPISFARIASVNDLASLAAAPSFQSAAPQSLTFPFTADMGRSLSDASLVLTNTGTGAAVATSKIHESFDPTTDTATFTFPGFAGGVLPGGNYLARIPAGSASTADGRVLAADDTLALTAPPHQVVGRNIFYAGSSFDGNLPAPNPSDFNAIATDKVALTAGRFASYQNYTSYDRGINGLFVDVQGLLNASAVSASDFTFRVGNNANPATWAAAPAPSRVIPLPGRGANGSDRIELLWPDGAIANTWLQVTVGSDANTGLAAPDVFYFGNAIGDSDNSSSNADVTALDVLGARGHQSAGPVPVSNVWDFNRDGKVTLADALIAQQNLTAGAGALQLFTPPAPPTAGLTAAGLVALQTPQIAPAIAPASAPSKQSTRLPTQKAAASSPRPIRLGNIRAALAPAGRAGAKDQKSNPDNLGDLLD